LTISRADIEKARALFEKAVAVGAGGVCPVAVYGPYAKFLWSTGGRREAVAQLFEKACAAASSVDSSSAADAAAAADVLASYASFILSGGGSMTTRAEQLLRASLTLQVCVMIPLPFCRKIMSLLLWRMVVRLTEVPQPRNATTLTRYAHVISRLTVAERLYTDAQLLSFSFFRQN
jgi:hypothetical protein